MANERLPTRTHRPLLRVGAAIASLGLALPACGTGGSSETSVNTVPGKVTTSIPGTTATELPTTTTTIEPKPTDVVEHRDGYDVLQNGGLLTKVESIDVEGVEIDTSWFGGFETHIESNGVTFGMNKEEQNGVLPKEILLTHLLRAFGNQHVEFVKADGQVDIQAYVDYLKANNWIDPEVYAPHNITEGALVNGFPTVVQSERLKLDLTKSFFISNQPTSLLEGFETENVEYFKPTIGLNSNAAFGITNEGQLYYSLFGITESGVIEELPMEHPYGSFPIADKLGFFLQLTSRITHPGAKPEDLWNDTFKYYNDPMMVQPSGDIPPYPVISVYDFVRWEAPHMLNSMFVPADS